jgi:hypothetical protein
MTVDVDLVEADLEGFFVGVTHRALAPLAPLVALYAFGGIGSLDGCFVGTALHILFALQCVGFVIGTGCGSEALASGVSLGQLRRAGRRDTSRSPVTRFCGVCRRSLRW